MNVVKIPADTSEPIQIASVQHDWRAMATLIGGKCDYIEEVKCRLTPEFGWVMVVDESGLFNDQPPNPRAQTLYPFSPIVGDVLICNTGWVGDGRDIVAFDDAEEALAVVVRVTR